MSDFPRIGRACYCAELRAAFAVQAPTQCAACDLLDRRRELAGRNFVIAPFYLLYSFQRVEIEHHLTRDGSLWVPCWAATLVTSLEGYPACWNVLLRARDDRRFRDACVAIACLADLIEGAEKILQYAAANGVYIPPPPLNG